MEVTINYNGQAVAVEVTPFSYTHLEALYLADHAGTGRKSPDGAGKESSVRQRCRAVSLGPHWPEVFCSPRLYGGLPDSGNPDGKEVLCRKK